MAPPYGERLMNHFRRPRNVGSLDKSSPRVGTGIAAAGNCGDVMRLQIEVGADERIVDAKFKTFGCGPAIAASSLTTEWLKGRTVRQAAQLRNTYIAEQLALPAVKLHCSVLAEDAVKAAIADWRGKQPIRVCPAAAKGRGPTA